MDDAAYSSAAGPRRVAHLGAAGLADALSELLSAGDWTPVAIDDAAASPDRGVLRAGLVVLGSDDPAVLEGLRRRMAGITRVPWIALLDKTLIASPSIREFIAAHCVDYLTLPLSRAHLLTSLGHAVGMAELDRDGRIGGEMSGDGSPILGEAPAVARLRRDIAKVAVVDAPVLIHGESGTGKELVARAIHDNSLRRAHPFIVINCVSLSPSLIHAELFGYERGAFTGAHHRKIGYLESAHGGTILLDEIGDLHPDMQVLLLRFLERRTLHRVGGREEIHVDARVLAATHVKLEDAVREGRFREDLYYRLNVLSVITPPLRARAQDIELLAQHFLVRYAKAGRTAQGFTASALAAMRSHRWPGNVRELLNRVQRGVVMTDNRLIGPEDLGLRAAAGEATPVSLAVIRADTELQLVRDALERSGGKAARAAQLLGVSRATMYRMLERLDLPVRRDPRARRREAAMASDGAVAGPGSLMTGQADEVKPRR